MTEQEREPFWHMRPDEVAECIDGVSTGLYRALWDLVGSYKEGVKTEDNPRGIDYPGEVSDHNKVPQFWDRLSGEHQAELRVLWNKREEY